MDKFLSRVKIAGLSARDWNGYFKKTCLVFREEVHLSARDTRLVPLALSRFGTHTFLIWNPHFPNLEVRAREERIHGWNRWILATGPIQSGLNNHFSAWRSTSCMKGRILLGDDPLKILPVSEVRTKGTGWKLKDKSPHNALISHVYRCEVTSSNEPFTAWTHNLHFEMAAAKLPAILRGSIDATKVSYTQLGSSGLRVSVPCRLVPKNGRIGWLKEKKLCRC